MELYEMDSRSRRVRERERQTEGDSGEREREGGQAAVGMDSAKPRHVPVWRPATPQMARDTAKLWTTWASSWPIRAIASRNAMQHPVSPRAGQLTLLAMG